MRSAAQASGQGFYYQNTQFGVQPFRPTGKGWRVTTPDFAATKNTANASLVNYGAAAHTATALVKAYLFVDSVDTSYTVSGQYAQAHDAKTWYPMNYYQNPVTISGWVANQNDYDNLVRFVHHSHYTALKGNEFSNNWFHFLDFRLFRPLANPKHTFYHIPKGGLHLGLIITDFDGGHDRFEFAKEFQFTCKVTQDFRDPQQNSIYSSIAPTIDLTQIFGNPSLPVPFTAGTSSTNKPQTPQPSSYLDYGHI